jgi:uncharacterized protein YjbJ (UPF0337 family)
MNSNDINGKLEELKGSVRKEWGKLTGDDLDRWQGRKEELLGKLEQRYGKAKAQFEAKVDEILAKF